MWWRRVTRRAHGLRGGGVFPVPGATVRRAAALRLRLVPRAAHRRAPRRAAARAPRRRGDAGGGRDGEVVSPSAGGDLPSPAKLADESSRPGELADESRAAAALRGGAGAQRAQVRVELAAARRGEAVLSRGAGGEERRVDGGHVIGREVTRSHRRGGTSVPAGCGVRGQAAARVRRAGEHLSALRQTDEEGVRREAAGRQGVPGDAGRAPAGGAEEAAAGHRRRHGAEAPR